MIRLDTIKLVTPLENIAFKESEFLRKPILTPEGEEIVDIREKIPEIFGFKKVLIDKTKETCKIEFSAKILNENYFDLINENTIERALDCLKTPYFNFRNSDLLDAEVYNVDCTENYVMSNKPEFYIDALRGYKINENYVVNSYNESGKNNGIVFRNNAKTSNERLIFYDKRKELQLKPNMNWIESFTSEPTKFLNQFNHVLRGEANHRQLKAIRNNFGVESRKLGELLKADAKPIKKVFERVESNIQLSFWNYGIYENMTLKQLELREGREAIIKKLNFDIIAIRKFLKSKSKQQENPNVSRELKIYKKVLAEMLREKGTNNLNTVNYIEELKSKIDAES